jgi:hypothetical protein
MAGTQLTKFEVATIIEQFLDGGGGRWDWDDFCSFAILDPYLDAIRVRCCALQQTHPSNARTRYCNDQGMAILRSLVTELRSAQQSP